MSYYDALAFRCGPPSLQDLILSARNSVRRTLYRLGNVNRSYEDLRITEGWTRQRLETFQVEQLQRLLTLARAHVEYYRSAWRRFRSEEIRDLVDLQRLPVISKPVVRAETSKFLADSARRSFLSQGGTSGSTGAPLRLYRDLRAVCREEARLRRWRCRAGIQPGDRRVVIRGDNFVPARRRRVRPWLYDRSGVGMWVSSYHLTPQYLPAIVRAIEQFHPAAIEGYPGSLLTLARQLRNDGRQLKVRAVLTSSEQVYEHQRQVLTEAFSADVFDQYGSAERVALASECSQHRLHVDMECCIVEIIRPDGTPCELGEEGEIVGTCLTNLAMPLIRYRTGDIGRFSPKPCPCGIDSMCIDALRGRDDDFVVNATGTRYAPTILTFPFEECAGVAESQIIHPRPGRLLIRLVPEAGFPDRTLAAARHHICSDLVTRLGGAVTIDFVIVPEIEKQPNGKFRWIVAESPSPFQK